MADAKSGSLGSLRDLNRRRVVEILRARGTATRAEIARQTGLSRSTVSSLVADLQASDLVVERGISDGAAHDVHGGRPPVLLSLSPAAGVAVGIDFGHRHLRVAIADLSSAVLAETSREIDVDHAATAGLDLAAALVEDLLESAGIARERVLGAGMGLPGPVSSATGLVGSSAILPGWVGVRAEREMSRRLGLPVHVDNDANLGALAEARYGAGRNAGDVVYVKVSSGIGAGLILGGRLHHGAAGIAGEIGHVLVDADGPVCRCGNRGCLETVAAAPVLVGLLRPSHGDQISVARMLALASAGDAGCRRVITDAGRAIGRALADLCNYLNPERIVVGGDLSAAGELLLDGVRESIRLYAIPPAADAVGVVGGVLGERAEVLGATALVLGDADWAPIPALTGALAG